MVSDQRDLTLTIPVLASLDIGETKRFYTEQLAFTDVVYQDDAYLIVRRGRLELHFWLAADRIHPENTSCYVRGADVPALYEEFRARGVERLSPFVVRPWNMKEFHLHDPHGNLLRFGCAPEESG